MIRTVLQSTQSNLKPEVVHSTLGHGPGMDSEGLFSTHAIGTPPRTILAAVEPSTQACRAQPSPLTPTLQASRSCSATRSLRRRPSAPSASRGRERARVRAARPRAVSVPCMYRASEFLSRSSRGALMQPRQGSPWTPPQEVPQASRPSHPPNRAWLHRRWWRAARP